MVSKFSVMEQNTTRLCLSEVTIASRCDSERPRLAGVVILPVRGVILEEVTRINAGASSASRSKSVFGRSKFGDTCM
ncbi:hypothetical protein XH97_29300 [Bradyrhizobium sp. CCBAU 53380]|nr:hypothetical protein [Bradyrhizobium sp. CCBAU 53380]